MLLGMDNVFEDASWLEENEKDGGVDRYYIPQSEVLRALKEFDIDEKRFFVTRVNVCQ